MLDKYRLVGASYDFLSKLYSGNAIHQCKTAMLREDTIKPGTQILFAGAGQGRDALLAAELGAKVTVVDISPTMISQLEKHFSQHPGREDLEIEIVQGDIMKCERFKAFDTVVANFFLNVFDREKMTTLLKHLHRLCKPGGQMIIGDFAPSRGGLLHRTAQNVYWFAAATAFFAAAGNAIHEIYDYAPLLEKYGMSIEEEQYFKVLGQDFYYAVRAKN